MGPSAWGYNWTALSLGNTNAVTRASNEILKHGYEACEALTKERLN
jgi:hypothetical protein